MHYAPRLTAAALAALVVGPQYLATAGTAGASPIPIPERYTGAASDQAPIVVVTHSGSPWWMFAIVAVAAAVATLAATLTVVRLRHSSRLQRA
jgi:hypothetical protein